MEKMLEEVEWCMVHAWKTFGFYRQPSLQFMSSSRDKLVSNLPNDAFKYTSEEIKNDKN